MNRQQYLAATIRRMKLFEREYLPGIYKIIDRQFKKAASALRKHHSLPSGMIDGLGAELMTMYTEVGTFYARKTLQEINKSVREEKAGFGLNQEWIDDILAYFQSYLLNKAVLPISQTTWDDINAILRKGEQEGWGIDRMAFELENSELPVWRARMIVRTELLKAQSYGKKIGDDASDWETVKTWVSAHDARTRHSHVMADGQTRRNDDKFAVRRRSGGYDMMDGPGDPEASAENVINCRCTTTVAPARDENGRLIRKRKISVILPEQVRRPSRVVTI